MLGMIEINLLPPQHRTVERTPLPVFLSLIVGILLIGAAFVMYVVETKKGVKIEADKASIVQTLGAKRTEAARVDRVNQEIAEARTRIDTVVRVAQARTPWTRVLAMFTQTQPAYLWLDSMSLRRAEGGEGELRMACNARGTNMQRFTDFRQALRARTNFIYHFSTVSAPRVDVRRTGEQYLEPKMLSFNMTLPLAQAESR
jgi:Tfp pilus assembly protein PilN